MANMYADLLVSKPESILDMFQSAAALNAIKLKVGVDDLEKLGLTYVVLRYKYVLYEQLKKDSEIIIETWPNPKGRVRFNRQFLIKDLEGNILGSGSSLWVLMDLGTRKIVKTDNFNYQTDVLYDDKNFDVENKIDLDGLEFIYSGKYQVIRDDIDRVGHMNNTKYLKMLYNLEPYALKEVTIDYIHEIKLDDEVLLYKAKKDDYNYLIGKVHDNLCFAIKYQKEGE